MSDIGRELSVAVEEARRTARGERAVKGHDEYYEFLVEGCTPFHFEIAGGRLKFGDGPAPRREPLRYTRLELAEGTLRAILNGDLSPVGAMERGELLLRTRLYGGGQMIMLLRAAYDLARARRVESGSPAQRAAGGAGGG